MTAIVKTAPAPRHPLAGKEMTCAEMIVQVLADEGVDTIFGYSGGAILPTYDAVFRYNADHSKSEEIRLIVPATEQGAGFMAAGYARSSRQGRRVPRHLGPGRDQLGDADPRLPGRLGSGGAHLRPGAARRDGHRRVPGGARLQHHGACAKHVFLVTDETKLEATMRTAFDIARSGPSRAGRRRHPEGRAARRRRVPGRRPPDAARLRRAARGARRTRRSRRGDAQGVLPAARQVASDRSSTPAAASSTATPPTSCAPSRSASASRS